jgi:Zn-dependent protease with chaperone function
MIWQRAYPRSLVLVGLFWLALGALAADFGQQVEAKYGLDADFATNLRVQLIGQRIARAAEMPNETFKVFNNGELNAFALPDGRVYLTSMMARAVPDDELAFVLGHEITHIREKHSNGQQKRALGGAILGAILVAVLGGSSNDIRLGADIAGGLTYGHYSRKDEHRADAGGVRLMTQAGYDPRKAAEAMQRLIDKYGTGDAKVPVLGWFASHPDSGSRKGRLLALAEDMKKTPPTALPVPAGIDIVLDPSAEHARAWVRDYLAVRLAATGQGQATPLVSLTGTPTKAPGADASNSEKPVAGKGKEEPLPAVTVTAPPRPPAYRLTLALRAVPAANAARLTEAKGTAVEATLSWAHLPTGTTGTCTARAQTDATVPWMAHKQLTDTGALLKLADGKSRNLESTLEATAVRRAAMAFAEVLEAGGHVDHSAPVTLRLPTTTVRVGDYLLVIRDTSVIAEVRIDSLDRRSATGTVLWGTHQWKSTDRIELAQ